MAAKILPFDRRFFRRIYVDSTDVGTDRVVTISFPSPSSWDSEDMRGQRKGLVQGVLLALQKVITIKKGQ